MSSPTTCPRCGHESFTASCPRCYAAKSPVHKETCPACGGHGWALYMQTVCPNCGGSGRVPVPMRSCLTDDRDDEADGLRAKVETARKVLERVTKLMRCAYFQPCGECVACWVNEAIKELSKP